MSTWDKRCLSQSIVHLWCFLTDSFWLQANVQSTWSHDGNEEPVQRVQSIRVTSPILSVLFIDPARKNESWRREGSAPEIMSGRAGRICLYVTWCSTASVILYYSNINMRQQLKKNSRKQTPLHFYVSTDSVKINNSNSKWWVTFIYHLILKPGYMVRHLKKQRSVY